MVVVIALSMIAYLIQDYKVYYIESQSCTRPKGMRLTENMCTVSEACNLAKHCTCAVFEFCMCTVVPVFAFHQVRKLLYIVIN